MNTSEQRSPGHLPQNRYGRVAPRMVRDEHRGDMFVVPGMSKPIAVSLSSATGIAPEELQENGRTFEHFHRSDYEPNTRAADQDWDGVAGETIYPTVGMMLCNHKDHEYKQACFEAYNRWIANYCAYEPSRLFGRGQTAALSVYSATADLVASTPRPKSAWFMSIIRGNQDVIAMMVMGGVLERNPDLVIACTEPKRAGYPTSSTGWTMP